MIPLKYIRENTDLVKKAIDSKNIEFALDELLSDDEKRREIIQNVENLKSESIGWILRLNKLRQVWRTESGLGHRGRALCVRC